jgi:hypothetical protein
MGSVALAGGVALKIKKLGSADLRWNAVTYREELMAQLQPGLTWRLGKDGATRLTLERMALVGPGGGVLLPGEQTLNLRYWATDHWELVVFEENEWKWSEDKTQLGLFHAAVGQEAESKKHAKSLDLRLWETTRGSPTDIARAAVTGKDAGLADIFAVPDDVDYSPDGRKAWDALPWVELVMRFGPHVGVTGFEPVKVRELHGVVAMGDGGKAKVRLMGLDLPEPAVRSEFLEQHEGEIPVGVIFRDGDAAGGQVLFVSGGELPFLSSRTRDGEDGGEMLEGVRTEARLKKAPRSTFCTLSGSTLTVIVAPYTYTFELTGE